MRFGGEALLSLFLGHNSEVVGALALRAMELFSLPILPVGLMWRSAPFSQRSIVRGRPLYCLSEMRWCSPCWRWQYCRACGASTGYGFTPACGDLLTAVAAVALLYFWRRKERKTALEEV